MRGGGKRRQKGHYRLNDKVIVRGEALRRRLEGLLDVVRVVDEDEVERAHAEQLQFLPHPPSACEMVQQVRHVGEEAHQPVPARHVRHRWGHQRLPLPSLVYPVDERAERGRGGQQEHEA